MMKPKWLEWAETQIAVAEFPGAPDNPKIIAYFAACGLRGAPFLDDETPWCAAFVGAALAACKIEGTGSAASRSYSRWANGKTLAVPTLGAITVMHRKPPKPGLGHVGFLVGINANYVDILGGNQSDAVNIKRFERERIIGFYWPKSEPIKNEWLNPRLRTGTGHAQSVV